VPAICYVVFALTPIALLTAYSVYAQSGYTFKPALDFGNYASGITGAGDMSLLGKTVVVMFAAAAVSTFIAYAVVYCVAIVVPRFLRGMMMIALFALFAGYLVRVFAWRILLGDEGIIATLAGHSHLLTAIGNLANTRWAVLLALVNFSVPLCILPIASTFSGLDRQLLGASRDLGAGPWVTFRGVVFPLTFRGAAFAFAIAFILCAGDYVTPALLGGMDGFMFASLIAQQFTLTFDWPLGAVLAIILMTTVVIVVSTVYLIIGTVARRMSGASATGAEVARRSAIMT